MQQQFAAGVAAALSAVLLWGAQFPIAKSTFDVVDPYHVSAIRYGVATLLLVPILAWREGRSRLRYYRRALPASVLGLVGMTCSPLLVFAGLAVSRPEHAAIIVSLQPSMTAIADWWLRGRRPATFTLACIATAFVGAVLVAVGVAHVPTVAGIGSVAGALAFLALGGVLAGMICWNAGIQRIGALNSMLMLNLLPIVVFAIRFAQGQRFEPVELGGAGLVIGALAANNLYLRHVYARRA